MLKTRREKFYIRCQEIIDDIHNRVANDESLSETRCEKLYGRADYSALLHELHLMHADDDITTMTSAMEWLYHSQYFTTKASDERLIAKMYLVSIISAGAAVASAIASISAVIFA